MSLMSYENTGCSFLDFNHKKTYGWHIMLSLRFLCLHCGSAEVSLLLKSLCLFFLLVAWGTRKQSFHFWGADEFQYFHNAFHHKKTCSFSFLLTLYTFDILILATLGFQGGIPTSFAKLIGHQDKLSSYFWAPHSTCAWECGAVMPEKVCRFI